MKRLTLIFLLSIITLHCVNAQNAEFTLAGKISDCETHKNLKGIRLKLMCSDGRSLEIFTDSLGNYFFGSSTIKINRQYILSTRTEMDLGYLNTSEKYEFGAFDSVSIKNIKKDFCLSKRTGCTIRDTNLTSQPNNKKPLEQKQTKKIFKSTDSSTGGFYSVSLELNPNGNVYLLDSTAIVTDIKESGTSYKWKTDSIYGKWFISKGLIYCTLDRDKKFIEQIFITNKYKTKGISISEKTNTIIFPEQTDTLYIRGFPCY